MNTAEQKLLQECKDEVAKKHHFFDWLNLEQRFSRSVQDTDKLIAIYYDEAAELFASKRTAQLEEEIKTLLQCQGVQKVAYEKATDENAKLLQALRKRVGDLYQDDDHHYNQNAVDFNRALSEVEEIINELALESTSEKKERREP